MTVAAPLWLLLLIPWTGLAVYLFRKTPDGTAIPFLPFWPEDGATKPRVKFGPPPAWVLVLLAAILLGIIAAARPGPSGPNPRRSATVIIDRGRSLADPTAYRDAIAQAGAALDQMRVGGRVRVIALPGGEHEVSADQFERDAAGLPPTALDMAADVQLAVDRSLRESAGPLVVVTGSIVRSEAGSVIGVGARGGADGVAVTSLSVRATPTPAAMIGVRNRSSAPGVLALKVDEAIITRPIAIGDTTEFVDLGAVPDIVEASAGPESIDSHRWVVRRGQTAGLDPSATIPAAVQRIARIYTAQHPAASGGIRVPIGSNTPADPSSPAVILTSPDGGGAVGPIGILDPALARDVTVWPRAGSATEAPSGYQVAVTVGGVPVVAVASDRRLWINLDLAGWSSSPSFVVFFGNVFDHVTGGGAVYESTGPTRLGAGWKQVAAQSPPNTPIGLWPGVYRSEDGGLLAINADPASTSEIVVPKAVAGDGGSVQFDPGWGTVAVIGVLLLVLAGVSLHTHRRVA